MAKKTQFTEESALQHMGRFAELLTPEQQTELLQKVRLVHLRAGEELYREGDLPQYLCCAVDGHIKISRIGVGGRIMILRLIHNGNIFGYRSYFAHSKHITSATAATKSSVYLLPLTSVDDWMKENVVLARFFVDELAEDLGHSDVRLLNLTQKHLRGRLAEALLILIEHFGFESDGKTLATEPSRGELADMANMTRPNAIRTLSSFVDDGVVSVDGRRITILDFNQLQMNSDFG